MFRCCNTSWKKKLRITDGFLVWILVMCYEKQELWQSKRVNYVIIILSPKIPRNLTFFPANYQKPCTLHLMELSALSRSCLSRILTGNVDLKHQHLHKTDKMSTDHPKLIRQEQKLAQILWVVKTTESTWLPHQYSCKWNSFWELEVLGYMYHSPLVQPLA